MISKQCRTNGDELYAAVVCTRLNEFHSRANIERGWFSSYRDARVSAHAAVCVRRGESLFTPCSHSHATKHEQMCA